MQHVAKTKKPEAERNDNSVTNEMKVNSDPLENLINDIEGDNRKEELTNQVNIHTNDEKSDGDDLPKVGKKRDRKERKKDGGEESSMLQLNSQQSGASKRSKKE